MSGGIFFLIFFSQGLLQPAKSDSSVQLLSDMVLVLYLPTFSFNGQSNARGEIMQQCLTFIYYQNICSRLHWSSCACCTSIKLFLHVHCDTSRCFRVICKEICHVISEKVWKFFWSYLMFPWMIKPVWKMSWQVNFPCQNPGCRTPISFILVYISMWKSLPVNRSATVIVAYFVNCYHFFYLCSLIWWL